MKEQFGQFVIFVTSLRRGLMKALLPNDMGFLFGLSHGRSRRFAGQAVFALAESEGVPPALAADRLAEARIRDIGRLRSTWLPR